MFSMCLNRGLLHDCENFYLHEGSFPALKCSLVLLVSRVCPNKLNFLLLGIHICIYVICYEEYSIRYAFSANA